MMMQLDALHVTIAPRRGWYVQWELRGVSPSHRLRLERSASSEGPWDLVSELAWNVYGHIDELAEGRDFWIAPIWRLLVLDDNTGDVLLESNSETYGSTRSPRFIAEAIRQHDMVMTRLHGQALTRDFMLFKSVTWGSLCYACVDQITKQPFGGDCGVCNGSRRIGGWGAPMRMRGYFADGESILTARQQTGRMQESQRRLQMSSWPIATEGNILMEVFQRVHWRVLNVSRTAPNGMVVSQSLLLDRVPQDHAETRLGLELDLADA